MPPRDTRAQILEAAYGRFAAVGIKKTSMEDVARAAQLSRATLYRYFPSKDALVAATTRLEADRFFARLSEAVSSGPAIEEVLVAGLEFATRALRHHEVLQHLLATEPETILPQLLADSEINLELVRRVLRPALEAEHITGEMGEALADDLARALLSYATTPGGELDDTKSARALVRRLLLPAVERCRAGGRAD
jgi:AcrR family transcriptional regulator